MKQTQLKRTLNSLLNGSCRQLSPKILFHKHFGGPPIGVTHSCRSLLSLFIISIGLFVIGSNITVNTSALTYSENVDVNFTFEPSINVSLSSSDLIIEGLVPGSASDSNTINIEVSTNNITGYTLSATAGNGTSYTSTDLVHNNSNNNVSPFTSLATNADLPSMSNANPNEWGYSLSSDDGTNWSNYSGLPYYTSPAKEITSTHINKTSTIQFKIGAKADNWAASGEYNNVINFYAITNPIQHYYIQDFTMSQCQDLATNDNFIVYDRRDENDYTVRYINGQCWMTQNLRITGTISAQYSNFTGNDFNVSAYSLDANDASYTNHCDSANGYNYACSKKSMIP